MLHRSAALFGLLALTGSSAAEPSLLAGTVRSKAVTGSSASFVALPLDDAGATELAFATTADNSTIKLTYNAECGVLGAPGVWVSIKIMVNGKPTFPDVGADFGFCSAFAEDTYTHQSAARNALYLVPEAGDHKVEVFAAIGGGKGIWRLDDTILVVEE